jgi:hypothetical protein
MGCGCITSLVLFVAGLAASPLLVLVSIASLYRLAIVVAVIILIVHLAGRKNR